MGFADRVVEFNGDPDYDYVNPDRPRIYYKDNKPIVFFKPDGVVNFATSLSNYPGWYAAPFNRTTKKLLLHEGIVPPLNTDNYSFPGPFEPYAHQPRAVENLVGNHRAWILDDPRTGKTPVVCWSIDALIKRGDVKRILILSPRRIVRSTWIKTLFQIMPHIKTANGNGSTKHFSEMCQDKTNQIVVANHDKMRNGYKAIALGQFDLVVVDEVNMFRHYSAGRSGKLKTFLKNPRISAWFMTGTINTGTPDTLYDLAKIINPHVMRMPPTRWRDMTMYPVAQGNGVKWKQSAGIEHLIQQVLTPCTRTKREHCFDIPLVTYHRQDIDLTPQQKKDLEVLRKDRMFVDAHGKLVTAVNPAVLVGKILQICCGAVYDTEKEPIYYTKQLEERAEVCIEEWRQTQSKVIVLSSFTHQLESLKELIEKKTNTKVLTLYGKTTDKEADQLEQRFQTDDAYQFVLADPESVQHGFTLSAANTVVWCSSTWRPEAWIQANDRPFGARTKDKQHIGIVYCVSHPIEARIYNHLLSEEGRVREELDLIDLCEKFINP